MDESNSPLSTRAPFIRTTTVATTTPTSSSIPVRGSQQSERNPMCFFEFCYLLEAQTALNTVLLLV